MSDVIPFPGHEADPKPAMCSTRISTGDCHVVLDRIAGLPSLGSLRMERLGTGPMFFLPGNHRR